jgi:hypothetical protein
MVRVMVRVRVGVRVRGGCLIHSTTVTATARS